MKTIIALTMPLLILFYPNETEKIFKTSLGQVSFFSQTTVDNIEAQNNQVYSTLDLSNRTIQISMIMNAFVFKKTLMHGHFNKSYLESDLYPKATFEGEILDFRPMHQEQTKITKGNLTIRNVTKEVQIKTKIEYTDQSYILSGDFELEASDYQIKIPMLLKSNITQKITVKFRFEYHHSSKNHFVNKAD